MKYPQNFPDIQPVWYSDRNIWKVRARGYGQACMPKGCFRRESLSASAPSTKQKATK